MLVTAIVRLVLPEPYGIISGLALSAIAIWFIGRRLNNKPRRRMIDEKTGSMVEIKEKHSLFWTPMEWWSLVIAVLCVLVMVK